MANNNTSGRGFAGMDVQQRRAIASMGGKAAHLKGTAHQFTSAEAQAAGSKGGRASQGFGLRATKDAVNTARNTNSNWHEEGTLTDED